MVSFNFLIQIGLENGENSVNRLQKINLVGFIGQGFKQAIKSLSRMTFKNAGNRGKPEVEVKQTHAVVGQRFAQRVCQSSGSIDGQCGFSDSPFGANN